MMKKFCFLLVTLFAMCRLQAQTTSFTLEQFGARADGIATSDGNMDAGSNVLKSRSAGFKSGDEGKIVYVAGAGKGNSTLIANISSVNSPNSVTLSQPAATAVRDSGLTYGTDCTQAFIKFNHEAHALRDRKVVLNMKPGTYLTSFNNWIAGIKDVTINGNGCNVICTHGAIAPNDFANPNVGLYTPSCFDNVDNNYYEHKSANDLSVGSRIQTVSQGSSVIHLMNKADIANFKAGAWLLIYGLHHEDFSGFPPDPRFFEYVKIKRVDADDAAVYIDRNLANSYDADWPEGTRRDAVGAARILSLNRDNFNIIEHLDINNINFLPFNGWRGRLATNIRNGRFVLYGFIHAKVSNLTASAAYFGTGGTVYANNINFKYECEPDKVLDSLVIEHSTITNFAHATGVNVLILRNNTFVGKFNTSPRVLYLDGNYFKSTGTNSYAMAGLAFNKGTDYLHIGTNTWECNSPGRGALFSTINSVKLNVARVIDNNTIALPFQTFASNKDSRRVIPGSTGTTASGKTLLVKRVYATGNGEIAVSGNFSSPPSTDDVFIFSFADKIDIDGKQIKVGPYANQYKLFQTPAEKSAKIKFALGVDRQ